MNSAEIAEYIRSFLMVFLRAGIFVSLMPMFGNSNIPAQFKIGIAVALALVLTPIVRAEASEGAVMALVFREVIFGAAMGLSVRVVFLGIELGGQAMSNAMGLSMASIFDPEFGHSSELSRLQYGFAVLVFLAMDVHHELLAAFVMSYEKVGIGLADIKQIVPGVIALASRVFVLGIKLAAPVMAGMMIANMLFGFISKAVPQMNVYFVSFPVYVFLAFLILLSSMPVLVYVMKHEFGLAASEMAGMISLGGGR
jgi:flagellar biosynthetic protein FliR